VNVYAVRPKATKFAEITQNNGHYAVQVHSKFIQPTSYLALFPRYSRR